MAGVLRDAGRRITPQRLAALRILAESRDRPSLGMVCNQVKKDFPTTSLATVYKTIKVLKELREVLELGDGREGRLQSHPPQPGNCRALFHVLGKM